MSEIQAEIAAQEGMVLTLLTHLKNGKIDDATACFAEEFRFKDRGIGLDVNDREHLAEFFQKTRELYSDSSLNSNTIFVSGDHAITKWTIKTVLTEPFYGGLSRRVPVSLHGASLVRIENGKITDWSDSTTTDSPSGAQP